MNATGNRTRRGMAAALLTLLATAGGAQGGPAWWVAGYAAVCQLSAPPAAPTLSREEVDRLLGDAAAAMQRGDFATADRLVDRAAAAGIRYPIFYRGETPSRMRRAIAQAKRNAGHSADPFLAGGAMPTNPFAASGAGTQPLPLPAVAGRPAASHEPAEGPNRQAAAAKQQADRLLAEARDAMGRGDDQRAERLVLQATQLKVPEIAFAGGDSPARLAWELQKRRMGIDPAFRPAAATAPVGAAGYGRQALHVPEQDPTQVRRAAATAPVQPAGLIGPAGGATQAAPGPRFAQLPAAPAAGPSAEQLMAQGEASLREGDKTTAWRRFQQANQQRDELPPIAKARLDSHLQLLTSAPVEAAASAPGGPQMLPPPETATTGRSMIESVEEAQRVLVRQLSTDVGQKTLEARELRVTEPQKALQLLQSLKADVEGAQLADDYRAMLARRVDSAIRETESYINDNREQIASDQRNAAVLEEIDRRQAMRLKMQQKKAEMVDQFHSLRDEQRYAEAELIAKQLIEMMPNDEVAMVLWQNAKFLRREMIGRQLRAAREEGTFQMLQDVDIAATPDAFEGREMVYAQDWATAAGARTGLGEANRRMTPREVEIQQKLSMPVRVRYRDRPLAQVAEDLSQLTGVDIHLDPRGLSQEGVSSDTPVTLELNREIMLKSVLEIILGPLHLSYMIKSEVLMITSEQVRDGELVQQVYYVADLVTPIPNFTPSNSIGLQSMINEAYAASPYGQGFGGGVGPVATVGSRIPNRVADSGARFHGQQLSGPQFGAGGAGGALPLGVGGPSPGGGVAADFDSLIDLIISTVASDSWAENGGGEAEIRPYVNNLSLVVSQTQAVQEEIADLLEQLRRLQDLQITIEVRFIRLNDSFFERIGIDFDVNINDKTVGTDDLLEGEPFETPRNSQTVGAIQAAVGDLPVFSSDLDIPFRQGSFGVAVPQFGGFDPGQAASFGFAILSDIEAYFLINAAQGDSRTNVLNAPKVTLFNGQTAFVADTSQTPFVISVIPVVGEFAAAQQPVIVVLSEGTMMNIQAVVSEDRRYVRLTVVPFFSEIDSVQTFTFEGSSSTTDSSSSTDADDDGTDESNDSSGSEVRSGTTVQLPTFSFISVSTTVSVPDGGTVLLGGIKRLNEGRNEFGVPLLSKVPYINRLFRNVGIGRETDSLMLMVTPRIIIQEEEEQKLGLDIDNN